VILLLAAGAALALIAIAAALFLRGRSAPAAAPSGPPITDADIAAFCRSLADEALPALRLTPGASGAPEAGGNRIGGPAWLAPGEDWPADSRGIPLELVAQLDFAALPALAGFPGSGLLQFFVGRSDLYGADFDDPARGEARVIWRPRLAGGQLHAPPPLVEVPGVPFSDYSPLSSDAIRDNGLPLAAAPFADEYGMNNREIDNWLERYETRPGFARLEQLVEEHVAARPPCHQVGGHPVFTQYDFRQPGLCDDYDRVLLRLTSDEAIAWGDAGEALFMIRAADLARQDFSSVAFYWDCP
jgi:uncharacterized protein YwqG